MNMYVLFIVFVLPMFIQTKLIPLNMADPYGHLDATLQKAECEKFPTFLTFYLSKTFWSWSAKSSWTRSSRISWPEQMAPRRRNISRIDIFRKIWKFLSKKNFDIRKIKNPKQRQPRILRLHTDENHDLQVGHHTRPSHRPLKICPERKFYRLFFGHDHEQWDDSKGRIHQKADLRNPRKCELFPMRAWGNIPSLR